MQSPLTPDQIAALDKPIDPKKVAHRLGGGGTQLSYIEGHEAIDAANRVFGYGSWGFEIIDQPTRDHYTDPNGEIKAMWYTAKIRLHVQGCQPIEEIGLVEVQIPLPGKERLFGQQVDVAMKGAITDALKRALRCYGDQFGNSLYDRALQDGQPKPEGKQTQPTRQQPATATTRPTATQSTQIMVNRTTQPAQAPGTPQNVPTPAHTQPVTPAQPIVSRVEDDPNFKLYKEKIHAAKTTKELSDLGPVIKKQVVDQAVIRALRAEYDKRESILLDIANAKAEQFAGSLK